LKHTYPTFALLLLAVGCGSTEPTPDELERAPMSVAGKPLATTPRGDVISDELVVRFAAGLTELEADAVADSVGGAVTWRGTGTGYDVVRFSSATAARDAASRLARHADVVWIGPNFVAAGGGISTSPGPVDLQWNLWAMKLDPTHGWATVNPGVRIAVLDTGAAYEDYTDGAATYARAPDLANVPFVAGYDYVNDDAHPNDDQGHGTHVTGVIAASEAEGIAAVALGAEVMPVKVLDATNRGTELALAEGIVFAVDGGANVINMSLSFPPSFYPSPFLQQAVDYAVSQGVVLVAATGNHGAGIVAYPAAFREVIAVGASELEDEFTPRPGKRPWKYTAYRLQVSDYSNTGYNVDVAAPSGRIDRDLDGDGNPEAILAQTFAPGDPTAFDYYFYAGTSQAAAQVSGVAAVMLSENPAITPYQLRSLLGETAIKASWGPLSPTAGLGFPRADRAIRYADTHRATRKRSKYFAAIEIVMRELGGGVRTARATVEISDARGKPVKHARVYGTFTGNAAGSVSGTTDKHGVVTFDSPELSGEAVVAGFQVEAVSKKGRVDHPRGFVRVDSCSLDMLASFAEGAGISTSPGPITIGYAPELLPAGAVPSVVLLNFAWTGAAQPMAIAIDQAWFVAEFPGAEPLHVMAFGTGISTSPLKIDPLASFHPAVLQQWQPAHTDACVDLVLRTYSTAPVAEAVAPLIVDPDGNCGNKHQCNDKTDVLEQMWDAWGMGISTSPIWVPGMGVPLPVFNHFAAVMQDYVDFGAADDAYAIGSLNGVLDAAGIGIMGFGGVQSNPGTGSAAMNP
jgi:serine protease